MSPQNILIGQIIVVFTTIILTTWYATQWVAFQFDYDAYLGTGFVDIGNHKVYAPWNLFKWWYQFDAYAPHIFSRGGQISAGGGLLGILFAVIGSVLRGRSAKALNTFGSSRWADDKQLSKAGLLGEKGVFWAARSVIIFGMMAPNISWQSRRHVPVKAWGWLFLRFYHGPIAQLFTILRARTGSSRADGVQHSPIACSLIPQMRRAQNITHFLRFVRASVRCGMFKT